MDNKKRQPPKWADNFLTWYCASGYIEEIQGDLHEAFYKRCDTRGESYASWFFVFDVLRSISLRTVANPFSSAGSTLVLRSYFMFVFRKVMRRKFFTVINLTGLSAGLAGVLLIYMYVDFELSFDRFNEKRDRIYRVYCAYANPGEAVQKFAFTPLVLAPAVKEKVNGVEDVVRVFSFSNATLFQRGEKIFSERNIYRTDSGFFNIFSAQFLAGNPSTALTEPHAIVLSRFTAIKYFETIENAIDGTLDIDVDGMETYVVKGVVEDFPPSAHFHFNALLSIDYDREKYYPDNWLSHDPASYVLISEGSKTTDVQNGMRNLTEQTLNPIYEKRFGKTYDEHKREGGLQEYRLQPLTKVHLYSADMGEDGNILYTYLFMAIGVVLICMASFNYINLSTARSAWEAKSAGIRKLLGATQASLRNLSLMESLGLTLTAALIAVALSQILLGFRISVIQQFIPLRGVPVKAILLLVALAIGVGLFSGLVPARLMRIVDLTHVVRGHLSRGNTGNRLRQFLVIAQFVASMALTMCTLLISEQLEYLQNKALGFDKENLVVIRNVDKLGLRKEMFKQEIGNETFTINSSLCYDDIGAPHNSAAFTPVELIEAGKEDLAVGIPVYIGDGDYLKTLGVSLIYGHPFPQHLPRGNQQIILNKQGLRAVGWQDREEKDLIGKMIDVNGLRYELAGVVEDYHYRSLRQAIGPMAILSHYYQDYELLMVRIRPGDHQQSIQRMQSYWKKLAPQIPFDYSFVDSDLSQLYTSEKNLTLLFRSFAGLAILIACLGIFGLAIFSAERRVKEIGVRKVVGASVPNIVFLLSKDILKLILVAFIVASPLVWYWMSRWLENFAYKIDIQGTTFIFAGALMLMIAFVTISFQAIKAALTNPTESLRNE